MDYVKINDPVLGEHIIKEPVLCELIKTKAMARLNNINQLGVPGPYHYGIDYSRLEHSLGCLILADLFNCSLEEKIMSLLHDISHMAFSHIYDVLIGNEKKEDYQDKIFFEFIKNDSEIPQILEKYNIDINLFKDTEDFTLLDKPKPQTCIDRLDYTIREFYHTKKNKEFVKNILYNLKVTDSKEIIFKTKDAASDFANAYLYLYLNHWNNPSIVEKQHMFVDILKLTISKKVIDIKDFDIDDNYIMNKLLNCEDSEILDKLKILKEGNLKINNKFKKLRYVNPKYINESNEIVTLMDTDNTYKQKIENILAKYE